MMLRGGGCAVNQEFDLCRVRLGQSLLEALSSIEASGLAIAIVEDGVGCVAGTLTDGDVRRALLGGAALNSPVDSHIRRVFTSVGPATSRPEVLDLMQSRRIAQIPILDADGRLAGLHTLHEILGSVTKPNWAVVMAGGRGERLRPITESIPKPMVKVAGRPILERLVLHLVGFGIREVFVSVNFMSEVIESHFGNGDAFGCRITYLREEKPLGTGGALSLLPGVPEHPLLVLNGDLLTQANLAKMLAFHDSGSHEATIGVHEYVHTVPYGVVDIEEGKVTGIREKPTQAWLANAGIYILDPSILKRVPKETYFPLPALVEECLERGEPVGAFRIEEDWVDVGRHHELKRARGEEDRP
jgi:dTDP-glucose pyrophosphorylase